MSLARAVGDALGFAPLGLAGAWLAAPLAAAADVACAAPLAFSGPARLAAGVALCLLALVLKLILLGALFRTAMKRKGGGPGGLQLGRVEWLIGSSALIGVVLAGAAALALLIPAAFIVHLGGDGGAVWTALESALSDPKGLLDLRGWDLGLLAYAAVALLLLKTFVVRWGLTPAAAVAMDQPLAAYGAGLGKGNTIKMLTGIGLALSPILAWRLLGPVAALTPWWVDALAGSAVATILPMLLFAGFTTSAYRQLGPATAG